MPAAASPAASVWAIELGIPELKSRRTLRPPIACRALTKDVGVEPAVVLVKAPTISLLLVTGVAGGGTDDTAFASVTVGDVAVAEKPTALPAAREKRTALPKASFGDRKATVVPETLVEAVAPVQRTWNWLTP